MRPDSQRGSALILTLLVAVLLLGLGLSVLWVSSSSMKVEGKLTRRQEAMAAAEVGVSRATAILATTGEWDSLLGTGTGVGCTSTAYSAAKGNILCDPSTSTALEGAAVVPAGSQTLSAGPQQGKLRFTVWIRNDPVETALGRPFDDTDRQVVVYVEGVGRDGVSVAGVEVTLADL